MRNLTKKGFQITDVPNLGMVLVVIAIVLGIGSTILTQVQTTQTTGGFAYNATQAGIASVNTLASWESTWAIIIAAAVVLGIVGAYLMFRPRD